MKEEILTLKEALAKAVDKLQQMEVPDADIDAWYLLSYVTGLDRAAFFLHGDEPMAEPDMIRYRDLVTKRGERIPLQHLTGEQEFMGLDFHVNEHVLIPRQDTECLVERVLPYVDGKRVLDVCTGSGCILLSLLLELPQALGTGVDVSEGALCVAKENRKRLGLEQRAELIQSDLFSADYFQKNSGNDHMEYDMLISNPPYIRTEDIEGLMEEVRFHDPVLALDGKENGLYFYAKITEQAGTYLKPGGWLMYEIGCDQGMDVSEIMKKNGFEQIEIKKDLAGLDRVVTGRKMQEEQNV